MKQKYIQDVIAALQFVIIVLSGKADMTSKLNPPPRIKCFNSVAKRKFKNFCKQHLTSENGRLRSWDSCYLFFQNNFDALASSSPSEELLQHAEAELGFYLASYGMYRSSTVLFHHNHSVYRPIIKRLFKVASKQGIRPYVPIVSAKTIKDLFNETREGFKESGLNIQSEKTLFTKILMGLFGCIPAFDSKFQESIKKFKSKNSKNTLIKQLTVGLKTGPQTWIDFANAPEVQEFFKDICPEFIDENARVKKYPIMRVIDLYFWSQEIGKNNL